VEFSRSRTSLLGLLGVCREISEVFGVFREQNHRGPWYVRSASPSRSRPILASCGLSFSYSIAGINNGRFLIMPWVRVDNLASFLTPGAATVMSCETGARIIQLSQRCWKTFVDGTKFKGTCYKAANWIHIGEKKGYKKSEDSIRIVRPLR